MTWGCTYGEVGNCEFIDSTMNKYWYLGILSRNLKKAVEKLGLSREYYLQQDNDTKHTAGEVKHWLLYQRSYQFHYNLRF